MSAQRPAARNFRELVVWQKAHEFVLAVYRLTESFPDREKFLAHDLGFGQTESLTNILEETSRLLNAYARAILASGS